MMAILGLVMLYSWGHLIYLIFDLAFKKMSSYEKTVTIVALVSFFFFVLGSLS